MTSAHFREDGFTLIEVLISFVILAFAMAALLPMFSDNSALVQRALHERHALQLAQSKLDAIGHSVPLRTGEQTGRFDDEYSWSVSITSSPAIPNETPLKVATYDVTVTVSWGAQGDQVVHLQTLRTGTPP